MSQKPKKPLEDVIRELGRYPFDAVLFVQECIAVASERVHGPMSPEENAVARWMDGQEVDLEQLRELHRTGTLPPDITDAVDQLGGPEKLNRHVSGQQLCWAIRDAALTRWGLMARGVLARWNIRRTEDIGAIIFALVENDWLRKLPTDRIEDFNSVFPFDQAFEQDYHPQTQ
jgi:uncharacterized repeat protein (TIGR04138 family)